MPDQKISQLTAATTPLTGTELVPLVQSGGNVKATTQDIANLAGGGGSLSAISVSITGGLGYLPFFANIIPAQTIQTPDGIYPTEGKWVGSISFGVTPNTGLPNQITAITFDDMVGISMSNFSLPGSVQAVSFPALKYVVGAFPSMTSSLQSISFPELLASTANINYAASSTLTSFTAPKLQSVGSLGLSDNPGITTLSFPLLKYCAGALSFGNNTALTTLNLASLIIATGNLSTNGSNVLATVDFTALKVVGGTMTLGGSSSANYNFPNIERISYNATSGTTVIGLFANATQVSFGPNLKQVGGTGGNVTGTTSTLNQASVDNILVRLAALDGTNGTVAFSNRTVTLAAGNAAPSATGVAAKATLIARGCTVTTN